MIVYNYGNLSQCAMERSVYLRSTDIEQNNWIRLLWSVPDEWLWLWSRGHGVRLFDCSIKKRGKIERIFAPVFMDVLNNLLFKSPPKNKMFSESYKIAMITLMSNPSLYTKYAFWRGKIKEINFSCETIQVDREKTWEEL